MNNKEEDIYHFLDKIISSPKLEPLKNVINKAWNNKSTNPGILPKIDNKFIINLYSIDTDLNDNLLKILRNLGYPSEHEIWDTIFEKNNITNIMTKYEKMRFIFIVYFTVYEATYQFKYGRNRLLH